jgi:hypothetical protein
MRSREQVVDRVDVECDVLHRAGGDRVAGVARVGDPPEWFGRVAGCLHERQVAVAAQFDEAVERVGHPVHPVQRSGRAPEHLGEERQLGFHVGRRQREVVHAVRVQIGRRLRSGGPVEREMRRRLFGDAHLAS